MTRRKQRGLKDAQARARAFDARARRRRPKAQSEERAAAEIRSAVEAAFARSSGS